MKGYLFNFEKEAAMKNIIHKTIKAVHSPGSLLERLLSFHLNVFRTHFPYDAPSSLNR
jgi:hypothetical protein